MQPKESKTNRHFTISMYKSIVRVVGFIMLALGHVWVSGVTLVVAELLGIAEEL